jgi:hypothetical protein
MMNRQRVCLALVLAISTSLIGYAATASGGNGPKGTPASLAIDSVVLINPIHPAFPFIRAEIGGGGFLNGEAPSVTLDGLIDLQVVEASQTLLVANIPTTTPDGDYTLSVATGAQSKQEASTVIRLGGVMNVACIDWFRSGPRDEHVHTEVHVEDQFGNAVIGAIVTWEAENDTVGVYQTNVSATGDVDGHADGAGCNDPSGSGVTGWFCCIGAAKHDGLQPPGKRSCDEGLYTSEILSVTAPPSTNMTWDGLTPNNGILLEPKPQ